MKFRSVLTAALALAAFALLTGASQARASLDSILAPCDQTGITQRFLPWGDARFYVPAPGGSFEPKTTSWIRGKGATIVKNGNPYGTRGYALDLTANATVTSPPICAHLDSTVSRMFARRVSGTAPLKVEVLYTDPLFGSQSFQAAQLSATSSWAPTIAWLMPVAGQINLDPTSPAALGGAATVRFRFTSGANTRWQVDDVWVDPRMRG